MNLVAVAGDLLVKGGKYIIRHPNQVAAIAGQIVDTVVEIKEKLLNSRSDVERYALIEEAKTNLEVKISEIESKVYELAEYYDNEFVALEKKNAELVSEIASLKEELQAYKTENSVYKKKIQKILMLTGILMGIGIIAAIVLAIIL